MSVTSHDKAYVCIHVFNGSSPVRLVSRPDGDWCFLCGQEHDEVSSSYRVVGIDHLFDKDPSLIELQDLPTNWEAERTDPGEFWLRTQCHFDA